MCGRLVITYSVANIQDFFLVSEVVDPELAASWNVAPLIVPPDMWADWLDPETANEADVRALPDSMPEPLLVPRVVNDKVNYVRNNGPELIEAT